MQGERGHRVSAAHQGQSPFHRTRIQPAGTGEENIARRKRWRKGAQAQAETDTLRTGHFVPAKSADEWYCKQLWRLTEKESLSISSPNHEVKSGPRRAYMRSVGEVGNQTQQGFRVAVTHPGKVQRGTVG